MKERSSMTKVAKERKKKTKEKKSINREKSKMM
jgi:hypothetical protein